jgi:hypothetical protein
MSQLGQKQKFCTARAMSALGQLWTLERHPQRNDAAVSYCRSIKTISDVSPKALTIDNLTTLITSAPRQAFL